MDLKKSKLDDDSFIYAKRDEKSTKERWQEMTAKEKWKFFKDYYLLKIILGAIIIGLLGKLCWDTFGPRPTEILNVGIDSYSYLLTEFEDMQDALIAHMDPTVNIRAQASSLGKSPASAVLEITATQGISAQLAHG